VDDRKLFRNAEKLEQGKAVPGASATGGGELGLADLFYFSRTDTTGAGAYFFVRTVRPLGPDALDVRFGSFLAFVVGMTHFVSAEFAFAAYITCSRHVLPSVCAIKKYCEKQCLEYHRPGPFASGKTLFAYKKLDFPPGVI